MRTLRLLIVAALLAVPAPTILQPRNLLAPATLPPRNLPAPATLPPRNLPAPATLPPRNLAAAYRDTAVAMRAAGHPYADWAMSGRHFLSFDPAGDGTAVEVVGDLAAADRIAVLVPGVDTRLRDFDRGLGGVSRRAPAVQARAMYGRLRATDPSARVAVVAWLGYDTPDGIGLDAISEARARDGAVALVAFAGRLHGQHPAAAIMLIGHSYGAIVAGLAAPRLPFVTDVVALGAPGMGAARASDLGGPRVWSALAPADWIRRVPQLRWFGLGHGRRPSNPAFGARPLPTGGVAGHDYYLTPGSATLDAVARIVIASGAP
ncbi:MAG TPA: alpha/beta hydrolase [Actinoplanes sp.]|nr:alpha/beta hydrolase [Actinoplanes sp.]